MSSSITWEENGVVAKYVGNISLDEVMTTELSYQSDKRFATIGYVIIDTREVVSAGFSIDDFYAVMAKDIDFIAKKSRQIMAFIGTNPLVVGFAEAYKNSPIRLFPLELFETEEDAREWIKQELKHRQQL